MCGGYFIGTARHTVATQDMPGYNYLDPNYIPAWWSSVTWERLTDRK